MPGIQGGQAALVGLAEPATKRLEDVKLSATIEVPRKSLKIVGENGLAVYKVTKTGKLQARRFAIDPDRRSLLVTTNKVKSLTGLLKWGMEQSNVQVIDISRVHHVVRGHLTKRWILAREKEQDERELGDENLGISILFRDSAGDRLVPHSHDHLRLESLDMQMIDDLDCEALVEVLGEMLARYQSERHATNPTMLLLQHHWIEMGKSLSDGVTQSEWIDLCLDRLNMSVRRNLLATLFRDQLKQWKQECRDSTVGFLPIWSVAKLLEDVRFHCMQQAGLNHVSDDPILRLWQIMQSTDPVPVHLVEDDNIQRKDEETISSVAFLSFIRSQQKEFNTSLEDAVSTIEMLNAQTLNGTEQPNGNSRAESPENKKYEERLSKATFFHYLMKDSNDLLDPKLSQLGSDDMSRPLSHYWINASHDTFWDSVSGHHDEQCYLNTLSRGVRCLELDVWDDSSDNPVVCRTRPTETEDECLEVPLVLGIVRQFLLDNPSCFPIILNIENHCSLKAQEKLAEHLFSILGTKDLMAMLPDTRESVTSLPAPNTLKGKAVIMGKIPHVVEEGARILNDDFDDENNELTKDDSFLSDTRSGDDDEDLDQGVVIGFDTSGPIFVKKEEQEKFVQHPPGELVFMAKQELEQAKRSAVESQVLARSVSEDAERAEHRADTLINGAGLTKEAVQKLAREMEPPRLELDKNVNLRSRDEEEGVEVQDFFHGAVENSRRDFAEADQVAIEAAENATRSLQMLNQAQEKLRNAEAALEDSYTKERDIVREYQNAASEARAGCEASEFAERRVEKVMHLLRECEDSSGTAENVVVTAMTEAKISEKRAMETEGRASRASAKAKDDRARADDLTKVEEDLEREAGVLHMQLNAAADNVKETRGRMDKTNVNLERANEQIKLIEQSKQYLRESQQISRESSEEKKDTSPPAKTANVLMKHTAKMEERRSLMESLKVASAENSKAIQRKRSVQESFEKTAYAWKTQTEVASKARKAADRSAHNAEELAEHAEEEREAANLRHVARERARTNVKDKDSYRQSLQAQLEEAQRAAMNANRQATKARHAADTLTHVTEELPSHDNILQVVEKRKIARDEALSIFHEKEKVKKATTERAFSAKRLYDTAEGVYNKALQDSVNASSAVGVGQSQDSTAVVAFNQARLARTQAEHASEGARYADSVVNEKQIVLKRATEYQKKMDRTMEISTDLAKMTFLHTTKYRNWSKSIQLPCTHVHSLAAPVLVDMVTQDKQTSAMIREFSKDHMCRVFPSGKKGDEKSLSNFDPMLPWALGCQISSMDYAAFDENIAHADGRFRRNGSSGYVLKPKSLTHSGVLEIKRETWSLQVLCGSNLPRPVSSKRSKLNPFVKVVVYNGGVQSERVEHRTKTVCKNGFCPVWDEDEGFKFTASIPSMAMVSISVWDKPENGHEEVLGSSAIPVSCLREGFRSLALFDAGNSRSGAYAFSSLLVKANKLAK